MTSFSKSALFVYLLMCAVVTSIFFFGGLLRNSKWSWVNGASPTLPFILLATPAVFIGILFSIRMNMINATEAKRRIVAYNTMLIAFFVSVAISYYSAIVAGVIIFTKIFSPTEFQGLQWQTRSLASASFVIAVLFTVCACACLESLISKKT